jgi:MFS family permease
MFKKYYESAQISRKGFFTVFVLLFNTFTWLYMTVLTIDSLVRAFNVPPLVWAVFYSSMTLSGVAGSILSNKIKRLSFLYSWMALGVITSLSLAFIKDVSVFSVSLFCFLLGTGVGLGMPSSLSFFADNTIIENRGRIGGIIFSVTNLGALPLAVPFMTLNFTLNSLILALWRGLGLVLFLTLKPNEKNENAYGNRKNVSFTQIFHDNSFILYFLPWTMFTFIDRLLVEFFNRRLEEAIIGGISAFVGGYLADNIGRKRVVVYGFILLGIAYGIIGIAPVMLLSKYLYIILDGFAAGILWVTCILILWGDLSRPGSREKYYVIGNLPLFLTSLLPIFLSPYIRSISLNATFSVASFFLFLAVLPLMYAPETLPERKIRLKQLKSYAEAAKKVKEKYLKKAGRG